MIKSVFVSSLFSDHNNFDQPTVFKTMPNYDYLLFTNLILDPLSTSWTIINVSSDHYSDIDSNITRSRIPKFNLQSLISDLHLKYQTITYLDAYLSPIYDADLWANVTTQLNVCDLVINRHPIRRNPLRECDFIVRCHKDTLTRMNLMKDYLTLKNIQPYMSIPVYQNNCFSYSSNNPKIMYLFDLVWTFLKPNQITHRDQPIHSYLCHINQIVTQSYPLNSMYDRSGIESIHQYTFSPNPS